MYLGPDQINFKGLWRGDLRLFEHQDGRHLWVMQYDYDSGSYFVEGKISRACLARTFEENGLTMSFRRVITPETLHKDRGLQRAAEQRERSKAPDRSGKGDEVDGLRLSELKRQPRSRTVSSSAHTRKAKS